MFQKPISIFLITTLQLFFLFQSIGNSQEVSAKQKRQLKTIAGKIDRAGRLFKAKKFKSCAEKIAEAQRDILEIASSASAAFMDQIKPEYDRLAKAHELLSNKEIELPKLLPLPETTGSTESISFVNKIAPTLIENCGRCHINDSKGDFSARSYDSLMSSLHVSEGRPETSRIVEVITDGTMPPNGRIAQEKQKEIMDWIRQGAKFDGRNRGADLNQLVGRPLASERNRADRPMLTEPSGTETVSFGLHVAPILIENCGGCHINSRRIQGNLSLDNFGRMLRGGQSGKLFQKGQPQSSLILRRIKGIESEIMPPRRRLKDSEIATIEKWIEEGATFDGRDPSAEIQHVAAVAIANEQTHNELAKHRDELSIKNWKLIMSSDAVDRVSNQQIRILGSDRSSRLTDTLAVTNRLLGSIAKELKLSTDQPFVKGKPTIFVLDQRYDLSELCMMLAEKELPKEQKGFWNFTTVDAYAAVVLNRGKKVESIESELARMLSAMHIASLAPDVPRWFADGVGYQTASRIYRKDDQAKAWNSNAKLITSQMQPYGFARGQLNDRDAGLAGYEYLKELKRSGRTTKILRQLKQGSEFKTAFSAVMGSPPDEYFGNKKSRR